LHWGATVETEEFGADSGLPRLEFIDIAEKSHQLLRTADYGGPSSRVDGFQDFEDDGRVGSAENVAACLHDSVSADSCLAEVKAALAELTKASLIREADDGYRIPTPAEDDWNQTRFSISPRPADENKLYAEVLTGFWSPTPTFSLGDTKSFKAGLMFNGKEEVSGDITFNVQFADDSAAAAALSEDLRVRSQNDAKSIFWVVTLDEEIRNEMREAYRSQQMIERKSRDVSTADGPALIADEKGRQRRHLDELKRRMKNAALSGQVWFRGNDRSPDNAADIGKAAIGTLGTVLPLVYDRFSEASAKGAELKKGVDALFTVENLNGLPPVFSQLSLLRDEHGKPVFKTDVTPLADVMAQITAKANYGEQATGRFLEDEFSKPPFGWDFEAVRLLALSLLRAGGVEAISKGVTIDSATSTQAKDAFSNNNLFRSTSFRPKKGVDMTVRVEAADNRTPPGRRGPGERDRPDQGHPARLGGERDHNLQRLAPVDPGRDQAGYGPFVGAHRDGPTRPRTRQIDAGQGGAGAP